MPISRDEIDQIIEEKLKNYLSDNKADDGYVSRESLEYQVNNKVDARNVVDHTFSGTTAESFEHSLGRIPTGYMILNQSRAAVISGDITTWTTKRVTLTSSVADNRVRFLFL